MIKIVAKNEISGWKGNALRVVAVVAALVASAIIMAFMGYNPFTVYSKILKGSEGSAYALKSTVNKAIPLATLSLGTAAAFRIKFWNIGGEGQFYIGAIGATAIALSMPNLPAPILLSLMFIVGAILGGFYAMIPAVLKAKWDSSETLVTLMLNYVAQKFVSYLQYGPWKDPSVNGFPKIAKFSANASLPRLFGCHIGWIIVIVLAVLLWILFKKTKLGYEIDVIGESRTTAKYAGIHVNKVMFIAVMISGGLCGVAGMMQASGIEHSLTDQLSGGLGFTAVITAWLAKLNPIVAVVVSFVFSMLIQGGMNLQIAMKIPAAMAQIIQGIIIFFVLGSEFFLRYKFVITSNKKSQPTQEAN